MWIVVAKFSALLSIVRLNTIGQLVGSGWVQKNSTNPIYFNTIDIRALGTKQMTTGNAYKGKQMLFGGTDIPINFLLQIHNWMFTVYNFILSNDVN